MASWITATGRLKKIIYAIVILSLLYILFAFINQKLGVVFQALTPPNLPAPIELPEAEWETGQNWSDEMSHAFHFKTQGSRTLNIPASWFLAMEAASESPLALLYAEEVKFSDPSYLTRFGFLDREKSPENPYGLPIGFATTPYQTIVGLSEQEEAIGFTCAACHTGQLVYNDKRYIFDGGPAFIDLQQLTLAVGASLGQTAISSKLPVLNGRFERFAKRVLADQYSDMTVAKLRTDLGNVVEKLAAVPNGIDVTEGFSRLDALNRIGNQVFSVDPNRPQNYVNINAPVNFPHIWTSSWFSWVQYDGSIMSPLIRNVGEAMGTAAHTNFTAPMNEGRFSNTVPINNLKWIETSLAGKKPPLEIKAFSGLQAPVWPKDFPPIDESKVEKGAALYKEMCRGCHLPALTRDIATGKDPDNKFWNYFSPITWTDKGETKTTDVSLLNVKIIPQKHMGTDPGQGNVLAMRTVDTAGTGSREATIKTEGLGIKTEVCVVNSNRDAIKANKLMMVPVEDDPLLSYAYALGATVQMGIDRWFDDAFLNQASRDFLSGEQPNCLQAGAGYKARPLNGVWATPPFLHNGSVPTLAHLLGPVEERPDEFLLGDPSFDPEKVGIVLKEVPDTNSEYTDEGYFILRTNIPGNSNLGHEFSDKKRPGVIGRSLNEEERFAIIEFLKTI